MAEHEAGFRVAGKDVDLDMIIRHLDPFYAECRAYGRIEESQHNGIVAVHRYGFTAVSAAQEGYLNETFNVSDWDRPSENGYLCSGY